MMNESKYKETNTRNHHQGRRDRCVSLIVSNSFSRPSIPRSQALSHKPDTLTPCPIHKMKVMPLIPPTWDGEACYRTTRKQHGTQQTQHAHKHTHTHTQTQLFTYVWVQLAYSPRLPPAPFKNYRHVSCCEKKNSENNREKKKNEAKHNKSHKVIYIFTRAGISCLIFVLAAKT